jgi:DNA (cytosine-5)-methyltransferase 1
LKRKGTLRLLDLFCGAGGAAMGYSRAGFTEIVGVDIKRQPRYPFTFVQGDALEYLAAHGHEFDAIHASPPCQKFSAMTRGRWKDREHPNHIGQTRELCGESGRPWVIENVPGAPLITTQTLQLCGTQFGLQTPEGSQLRRHRWFESPFIFALLPPCQHNDGSAIGVYGGGQHPKRRRPATIGVWGNSGGYSKRDDLHHYGLEARRAAMGIDWMNGPELSEAIPPAYTEFIGRQLLLDMGKAA